MNLKKHIVFILLSLFLFSCNNSGNKGNVKRFRNIFVYENTMPVVKYNIGEKGTNFIVDTGSDVSIIDDDYYLNHMDFFNFIENSSSDINTISGTISKGVIVTNTLLNDSIPVTFYITDIDNVKREVFIKTGKQIDGILGCDFLYDNKAIIDFKRKELRN